MSKSFFTKSRSTVTLAALWQLNKQLDHSSLERMSTFFVPRENHFFKFSCIMRKHFDNWKSIQTIHPVNGCLQFFLQRVKWLFYFSPLLTTLWHWKGIFVCHSHDLISLINAKQGPTKTVLGKLGPSPIWRQIGPRKGAGSFQIHRKTKTELWCMAVLGIWERPNLAHNF